MKFFSFTKGWGFIEAPGLPDIFLLGHVMNEAGFIRCPVGTPLEVWYHLDSKGPVATRVAPLGET